ncbi:MAG: HAMP domain-containing sensor histidine kinase [Gracilimonas sp.]
MFGITHFAGVLISVGLYWNEFFTFPLQIMEVLYLHVFFEITPLYLSGIADWLSRETLLMLFGFTLFALAISVFLLFTQKSHQKFINQSIFDGAASVSHKNEDIHRFISVVSHDLRTPLNSIAAIADILAFDAETLPANEVKKYAGNIYDLSMRINHLVNNMVDANNLELGEVKLELKSISLEKILTDIYASIQILGEKKSIKTSLEIQDNLPKVIADENALNRIIENLINNAYKFSESESEVRIRAEKLSKVNKVRISIEDEGPGFTEDDRKNIYNKFSKLSANPTGNEKSTGLGLYIVYTLLKRMNGDIDLESKPGEGSVFSVILNAAS